MATVTTGDLVLRPTDAGTVPNNWKSTRVPIADTLEADLSELSHPHVYIGVVMFDSGGAQVDAATAGTFTVSVKLWNTARWESPETASLGATALATTSVRGPVTDVRVVPDSVPGGEVSTYEVRVTGFHS